MQPLFSPNENFKRNTNLSLFLDFVNSKYNQKFTDYWSLHDWSIKDLSGFWSAIWEFCSVIGETSGTSYEPGKEFWSSQFFPESRLNFAENLLMRGEDDDLAITGVDELGNISSLSRRELRKDVAAAAAALKASGIESGDRVVAWSSNSVETSVYALGALSIGAIVSTCSTDFAPSAVIDRFGQIQPKVLLASPTYVYAGKHYSRLVELKEIVKGLTSLQEIVVVGEPSQTDDFKSWSEWIGQFPNQTLRFERFPFDHPSFILFSSGTTGKPKCIVHKTGGVLLKLLSEHILHLDIGSHSKLLYYTTTGWMMWNWLLGALATSASIVLYSGSPVFPQTNKLIKLSEQFSITHLGISAKYAELLKQQRENPLSNVQLDALLRIISTGSPLSSECFDFLYRSLPKRVVTASISGGTDLCGCFLHAIPTEPIHAGEMQGPALGFKMNVYGADGEEMSIGQKGELVCETPFPSIPLGFWGDDEDEKFQTTYFEKFPGVWTHGDFASKTIHGGYVIHGRSDATLNSGGIRIGTAEIYGVVDSLEEISESIIVAKSTKADTVNVLFVVLRPGYKFSDELASKIKKALRDSASPRHVPDYIFEAPELPRTKSNKLVELAVTDIINGREIRNYEALLNPNSLKWFEGFSADGVIWQKNNSSTP